MFEASPFRGDIARGFVPLYEPVRASMGNVCTILPFATLPFQKWSKRVQVDDQYIGQVLDFVERVNVRLFNKYAKLFYGF